MNLHPDSKLKTARHPGVGGVLLVLFLLGSAYEATAVESPECSPDTDSTGVRLWGTPRRLSLCECFDRANSDNKDILVARAGIPVSQSEITIAGAIPNPQFNLQYGFGPPFNQIAVGNTQQFGWSQEFQVAGKREKKIDLARSQFVESFFTFQAMRFAVHNKVRRAYSELATAEAYGKLVESEGEVAQGLERIARKRFETAEVEQTEVLQANLAVMQFETELNQAKERIYRASAELAYLIGDTKLRDKIIGADDRGLFDISKDTSGLAPSLQSRLPVLENLLPAAYAERSDLKALIQNVYSHRDSLRLACANRIPNPVITGAHLFTTFRQNQNVHPQRGASIQILQEVPVLYQHQGEVNQVKAMQQSSQSLVDQQVAKIATDIVTAYQELLMARASIISFRDDLLPSASEVALESRKNYEVGKGNFASALVAQQQFQNVRQSYFDAVVAYQTAWADLEEAMGVPLR